ncbi:DUF2953 domain-containing protein, partial [Eubacteriales bacterium OttesenSCG-928-M02]|nr:DUF2953 domain-containing protein [Eubacteriales bacterium OttesenSCG-928-M02]
KPKQPRKKRSQRKILLAFIKRLIQKIKLKRLHCTIVLGTGDAASAAMLVGILRILAASIFLVLPQRSYQTAIHGLIIQPDFQVPCFFLQIHCIGKISLANSIGTAFYALRKGKVKE